MAAWGLADWDDLAGDPWPHLLAGNVLSISVSDVFRYGSLYEVSALSADQRDLFRSLDTTNFEAVLGGLLFAQAVDRALGRDPGEVTALYEAVRSALVAAISDHHVEHAAIDEARLRRIRDCLRRHRTVWLTSYDLVAYWAVMTGADGFYDAFWTTSHVFDPARVRPPDPSRTTVWWPHGAIHLHEGPSGRAVKHARPPGMGLLAFLRDVVAAGLDRPLIVTEGTALEKRRAIAGSAYLTHAVGQLGAATGPLVVFGQSLGPMDAHLVDAIAREPARRVAYGVWAGSQNQVDQEVARVAGLLPEADLVFFDSATHPLGGVVPP